MTEPLDPKEAATLFYAGNVLAYVSDPNSPFVCGQWQGRRAYVTRIPFDEAGAEAYFTDNPVIMAASFEPPAGPPVVVDVPYVGQSGDTLSCTMGNWQNEPTSYDYQWRRDGEIIAGEDDTSYTITGADPGSTIDCAVTAINSLGSATVISNGVEISPAR